MPDSLLALLAATIGGAAGRGRSALAGLLILTGYRAASRSDVAAATEAAALIVLAVAATAWVGQIGVASGRVAVTALLLLSGSLPWWVSAMPTRLTLSMAREAGQGSRPVAVAASAVMPTG